MGLMKKCNGNVGRMKRTTLCYIENNGKWLMLYRNKKPDDPNKGKWLGIGGKIEDGETPEECNYREVLEETGIILKSAVYRGIIEFRSDTYEDEKMYLFTSDDFEPKDKLTRDIFRQSGEYDLPACDEGELKWIPKEDVHDLPMWEGDRAFIEKLIEGTDRILMTLQYTGEHCEVIYTDEQ